MEWLNLCMVSPEGRSRIQTNKLRGININNKTIKLSMLADDLTLILINLVSVENALKLLNKFSKCLGLKINKDKTKAKSIGT